jgi:hypothetical protein
MRRVYVTVFSVAMIVGLLFAVGATAKATSDAAAKTTMATQLQDLQELQRTAATLKAPSLQDPEWLQQSDAAEAAAKRAASYEVTYSVSGKGVIGASMTEFRELANATLNDARGWSRMGVSFREVSSGGMFTLVLSEAALVPSFSTGCSVEYSCRVGKNIIINQDRWMGASASWNSAGGTLRDYRHMVINHETGHWLGHDHEMCGGMGQSAPVMLQQSIDLQGCKFNPWPLANELWSSQLGIAKP